MAAKKQRVQIRVSPVDRPFVFLYDITTSISFKSENCSTKTNKDFSLSSDGTYLYYTFSFSRDATLGTNRLYFKVIVDGKEIQQILFPDADINNAGFIRTTGYGSTDENSYSLYNVEIPSALISNYNPSKSGEGLFSAIRPIINKRYSNGEAFKNELANTISSFVCINESLTGAYVGTIPGTPPVPSTELIPTGRFVAVGKAMSPAIPLNYVQWLKNTLASTLTWQIVANTPHVITTPPILQPLTTALELLGDLSSVQTPEGVWALLCDIIMFSIQSAPNRIIPLAATCSDGSSGTITWLPLDIPSLTHDFVYAIDWDVNNTKLVEWAKQYIDVDNEILYGTIEIPLTEQMYPAAAVVWKGLKEITHNCKFYKQQSSGEKILLATA